LRAEDRAYPAHILSQILQIEPRNHVARSSHLLMALKIAAAFQPVAATWGDNRERHWSRSLAESAEALTAAG